MLKQRQVSDIVRAFADLLDGDLHREALAKVDPLRIKLADMCNALGRYAEACGATLKAQRLYSSIKVSGHEKWPVQKLKLTDELRRFADMLERRHAKVREVDPGYRRLGSVLLAMQTYASWLGEDLGIGGGAVVTSNLRTAQLGAV